ncbi:Transcription factor [Nymphaea thermarum]|nr:Transcription factor [Nymphaea thermarum]
MLSQHASFFFRSVPFRILARMPEIPAGVIPGSSDDVPMPNARASAGPELPICYSGTLQMCTGLQLRYRAAPSPSSLHNHTIPDTFRSYYPASTNEGKVAMSGAYAQSVVCWKNCQYKDVAFNAKKRSAKTGSVPGREARLVEPRKRKSPHSDAYEDPLTDQQQPKPPVRKSQKLGDKVNALQQLVSPFGKALSMPYFNYKSSFSRRVCDDDQFDLRSRGLCLVPVSSANHFRDQETRDISISGRATISPCLH